MFVFIFPYFSTSTSQNTFSYFSIPNLCPKEKLSERQRETFPVPFLQFRALQHHRPRPEKALI